MSLSKSLYIRGLQCVKSLLAKKYKKDVLGSLDATAEAIFANIYTYIESCNCLISL